MKYIILIVLFVLASSNGWAFESDKKTHVIVSGVIAASGYTVCRVATDMSKTSCAITAALATLAIGGLKEVGDTHNSKSEHAKDLLADSIGIGAGILITIPW